MKCTSCIHTAVCHFRSKLGTLVNNHSHYFRRGSYAAANNFAEVCNLYSKSSGDITLAEWEKQGIIRALQETNQNRTEAAKLLGIGERTLYRKLHKYHLFKKARM